MANFTRAFKRSLTAFKPQTTEVKKTSRSSFKFNTSAASKLSFTSAFRTVASRQPASSIYQAITAKVKEVKPQLPQLQYIPRTDYKLQVPNLIQGNNECGPTSLAMIMQYYGINPGNFHNMFESDTVGHGPLALKQKAVNKNMIVRQENYGDLNDLAALVDKGIPVLTLGIYGGGSNSSISNYIDNAKRAHWMVVTGYKKNDSGQITHVYFNNPNRSATQCWTASDFKEKFWNNNIIPGGHRYYMAMAKKGTFQESALKQYLPSNKLSDSFENMLSIVDGLEKTFYAGEKAANTVADAAEDVWDEVSSWFS